MKHWQFELLLPLISHCIQHTVAASSLNTAPWVQGYSVFAAYHLCRGAHPLLQPLRTRCNTLHCHSSRPDGRKSLIPTSPPRPAEGRVVPDFVLRRGCTDHARTWGVQSIIVVLPLGAVTIQDHQIWPKSCRSLLQIVPPTIFLQGWWLCEGWHGRNCLDNVGFATPLNASHCCCPFRRQGIVIFLNIGLSLSLL